MLYDFFEEADMHSDPLTRMLRNEGAEDEADALEAMYRSALYKTKTSEKDRDLH